MPKKYTGSLSDYLTHKSERSAFGCLLWIGYFNRITGYGEVKINRTALSAHRAAYETWVGPIPKGHQVQHLCDGFYDSRDISYRRCIEPTHLTTGTHTQNSAHMTESGRAATGERHGSRTHPESRVHGEAARNSRLQEAEVRLILSRYATGELHTDLSREYGVSESTVRDILRRRTWKHITAPLSIM